MRIGGQFLINLRHNNYAMYKTLILAILLPLLLTACTNKPIKQGKITYAISYQLPDSLSRYAAYLPTQAMVYFKGDSTVTIQQQGDEATTVISYQPTSFLRVLLHSAAASYQVDYARSEQSTLLPAPLGYHYMPKKDSASIAGYRASKYEIEDKGTGLISEIWYSKKLTLPVNYLTMPFDTTYGVAVKFTTKQNEIPVTTTLKEIKFEAVPDGVFATPPGYSKITPQQFKDMPVGN